jgi:glycosyltransferase involved in cell wall biosynthesis
VDEPRRADRALRVLHVASGDLWGGAEAFIRDLLIAQLGSEDVVPSCILLNEGALAIELRAAGIPVAICNEAHLSFAHLLTRAHRLIRHDAPSVVHSHRLKEHALAALATVVPPRGRARPALVATVHGAQERARAAWDVRGRAIDALNRGLLKHRFAKIVAVSEDLARTLRPLYGDQSVTVVHNGIDVAAVRRRATGTRADVSPRRAGEIRLLAAGRLVPVKRFDLLPQLAKALAAETGRPVTILLAGEGPLAGELAQACSSLSGDARVQMLGFHGNVPSLICEVDALVMTSDNEGLPMVALESAALGCPVYAFNVGGLPEIVGTAVSGALAPVGNVTMLARLIAGRVLLAATSSCTIQVCEGMYVDVYRTALAETA